LKTGKTGLPENDKTAISQGKWPFFKWLRGLDLNQRPSGYEPVWFPRMETSLSINVYKCFSNSLNSFLTSKIGFVSLLYHLN